MSDLRLYNTLSRDLEPLRPREPGKVRLYVCGPTTYDVAHAGNARTFTSFDLLFRHLRASGFDVTYVRNITDVDDKILDRAARLGEPPMQLSARYAEIFAADMRELGCLAPTHEPKVSEHMAEIFALIAKLVALGAAYVVDRASGARDVYFAVRKFNDYGKLSRRWVDDLLSGARVDPTEGKRDPLDFALWKGASGDAWGWESPWGKGRPGWHIECSAMSERYLGYGFDIHGGGMDLIFPHHENEIAQSEAAHGGGCFASLWLHAGFLDVDKEKMSKSLGNFVRPADVYVSNDPEALRYLFLTVHYRGPLNFEIDRREDGRVLFLGVDEAERRVDYLYATSVRLGLVARTGEFREPMQELAGHAAVIRGARQRVATALDDDLNSAVALAVIGELARTANELCDLLQKRKKDARLSAEGASLAGEAQRALLASTDVLGLLQSRPEDYAFRTRERRLRLRGVDAAFVEGKLAERLAARQARAFSQADALRAELDAMGIELADGPSGTTWTVKL